MTSTRTSAAKKAASKKAASAKPASTSPLGPADLDDATDEVLLYQSRDIRRLRELGDDLQKAMTDMALGGDDEPLAEWDDDPRVEKRRVADEAARIYDEAHAEAKERATRVQIAALGYQEYMDLVAEHPPREDVFDVDRINETGGVERGKLLKTFAEDRKHGFNVETMARPLVTDSVLVEGQFDDEEARDEWLRKLSTPRWSRLYGACVRLNEDSGPDPKASASLMLERMSSAISRSQTDSG